MRNGPQPAEQIDGADVRQRDIRGDRFPRADNPSRITHRDSQSGVINSFEVSRRVWGINFLGRSGVSESRFGERVTVNE